MSGGKKENPVYYDFTCAGMDWDVSTERSKSRTVREFTKAEGTVGCDNVTGRGRVWEDEGVYQRRSTSHPGNLSVRIPHCLASGPRITETLELIQ